MILSLNSRKIYSFTLFSKKNNLFLLCGSIQIESLKISLAEEILLPKGELKLATTRSLASLWLPYYLTDFLRAYPDITLSIDDHGPDLNIRETEAILGSYLPHQPDYVQRYLTKLHFQLYASPGYIEKFGLPTTFEELDWHCLLIRGTKEAAFCDDWLLNKNQGRKRPRQPYMTLNSEYSLYQLALSGFGLVTLAKEYPCLEQSVLIPVLSDIKGPSIELYYIYHQHQALSRRVTALGDYLEEKFQRDE